MQEGPCILPHQRETLKRAYEAELDFYERKQTAMTDKGIDDPALDTEIEAARTKAEERLMELEDIPLCEEPAGDEEGASAPPDEDYLE
jgi:hypothetical protein